MKGDAVMSLWHQVAKDEGLYKSVCDFAADWADTWTTGLSEDDDLALGEAVVKHLRETMDSMDQMTDIDCAEIGAAARKLVEF